MALISIKSILITILDLYYDEILSLILLKNQNLYSKQTPRLTTVFNKMFIFWQNESNVIFHHNIHHVSRGSTETYSKY